MPAAHDAEYWRRRRAEKRKDDAANGNHKTRDRWIPPEVLERGKILQLMMDTPVSEWPASWTRGLK
jgi:hypothetical protein